MPPTTLQLVQIYFDTATFDDIERDKKIKTEAQLSLIRAHGGGNWQNGIKTEIIIFLVRLVGSFRGLMLWWQLKFWNHLISTAKKV